MTAAVVAFGGWVTAGGAAVAAVITRRALAARMEAVARACHELRGPLSAARLGLALGARAGELSAARIKAIDVELRRAGLALDDLTAVRSARPPTRAVEEVDVQAVLRDSIEAWTPSAAARGAQLKLEWSGRGGHVKGDRVRIAQAIGNLVANAIEHGGGAVHVQGRSGRAHVRVEVIDAGPGLPAPVASLVRGPRHGVGPRGRGLAIASAIAKDHGGRLASAPSRRGARVVLELPAIGSPASAGRPAQS